jgi:hypothetical protein
VASNSGGVFVAFGPKTPSWENLVPVAMGRPTILTPLYCHMGRHIGQVEVWAEPLYKVLWPNLQHLSYAIGQCLGFFGMGLVCKAP